jgi:2'-5' RNA ligase
VQEFDGFRAPLSQEKRAERIAAGLSAQQTELLDKWGYPYVMDQFRMHITLTNSLNEKEGPIVLRAAQKWFAPILEIEHSFDRFCLYKESAPGAPFERIADYKFQASTNETRP